MVFLAPEVLVQVQEWGEDFPAAGVRARALQLDTFDVFRLKNSISRCGRVSELMVNALECLNRGCFEVEIVSLVSFEPSSCSKSAQA